MGRPGQVSYKQKLLEQFQEQCQKQEDEIARLKQRIQGLELQQAESVPRSHWLELQEQHQKLREQCQAQQDEIARLKQRIEGFDLQIARLNQRIEELVLQQTENDLKSHSSTTRSSSFFRI